MKKFFHDIIEQEGEELNLSKALEAVMSIYGPQGDVKYTFEFAMTKRERQAYRFEISGEGIVKQQ